MASLAILNAISAVLSLDILVPANYTVTQDNTSASTGVNSPPFSNWIMSFFPFLSLFLSLAIKHQDMLKLMVIGGLIETFRRFAYWTWNWLLNTWFITAFFEDSDDAFEWMMVWLGKQNIWAKAREVQISTHSWGQLHHKGVEILADDSDIGRSADSGYQTKRRLAYLPAFGRKYWLRYKGTWMSVSRSETQQPSNPWSCRKQQSMEICLFTRDHRILRSLLQDAKKAYKTGDESVDIYGVDQDNQWCRTSTRKKRPLQSIILEPEVKNMVLDDVEEFLSSEKWYTDRGIPYRRGYLLYGVPGSGKTSLIHGIAGELGLDIYVVSLAKRGLDDSSLNNLISYIPSRSIALMEDIDAAFPHTPTRRDGILAETSSTMGAPTPSALNAARDMDSKGVTLSGLLNALDGVAAQEGRILFATTNHRDLIDEALCRAGRMDMHVEFTMATRWQAKELFLRFFPPSEAVEPKERDEMLNKLRATARGVALETQFSREEIETLAEKFVEAVPEGLFSMAGLQGHLMRYKERPQDALDAAAAWVEKESRKRGIA